MSTTRPAWVDETVVTPQDRSCGVQAANVEPRPWLKGLPVCLALNQYQIIHAGIGERVFPSRVVRTRQTTTFFLACFRGQGRVLIDGQWQVCRAGYACLLPAHTLNAFQAVAKSRWHYCWVCYRAPSGQRPMGGATVPVMARYNADPLRSALQGLVDECRGPAQPALLQHWTDLVQAYVQRFVKPPSQSGQLRLLWERVEANLPEDWSLARLAREAGYSGGHLGRLCLSQLGRSPRQQVIYLRMRRAAELLVSTERTVETIAREVGYQNQFVFSNTFTKWIGWRPSDYRRTRLNRC